MRSTPSSRRSAATVSSTNAERATRPTPRTPRTPRTHGYTRPGRLALLDAVLLHCERALIERTGPEVFVDVGVGEWPWTTLETAERLHRANPALRVVGVELDPDRLRHAKRLGGAQIEFRLGGFELPLGAHEPARLVRAMNVLREYDEARALLAHQQLTAALVPGGLLVEGTSSRAGGVACAHFIRKREGGTEREALALVTDFTQGFSPWLFRDRLPRDLRRRSRGGAVLHAFFASWDAAFRAARSTSLREPSALFALAALELARRTPGIDLDPQLIERGVLLWRPPAGVPSAPVPAHER
jgi:hypothetical protein